MPQKPRRQTKTSIHDELWPVISDTQLWEQTGPSEWLPSRALCRGPEGRLLLTLPHHLLPVFHGCLFASADTIPAVSGDIPAPTAALLRNRARQIHADIFSERHVRSAAAVC
ncbi:hypothetical protein CesoFtcFv8_016726 [Champsocephalus esox]|uniref:Uncharacterized protein n=1 Tax=Champsocephalus esox TaxID=159716 RepID=A0AAN8BN19_9TELE|nr:hypothetical protein CesoFtcFv8_016726 [Champsocephalus esox]